MACIYIDNVTVEYQIPGAHAPTLQRELINCITGGLIVSRAKQNPRVRALEGVSLSLKDGDRIAVIGPNGAGKTTLIRLVAGCLDPVCGTVNVRGRISALLAIGAGMDGERTGLENIYHMGLHLLMLPREIDAHIDDILEFSELGEFIHLPMRTYSDGMKIRLAYAVATCVKPDILLLDEGIGAGDAKFMEKARQRTNGFYASASIVVMASHNTVLVRQLCNKAVLLHHGRILNAGPVEQVLSAYEHIESGLVQEVVS